MNFSPIVKKQTISAIEFHWCEIPGAEVYKVEKCNINEIWTIVYWYNLHNL